MNTIEESSNNDIRVPSHVGVEDIRNMEAIPKGGTGIVIMRHGKYITDPNHPDAGCLTDEAEDSITLETESLIISMLGQLSYEERQRFGIFVVASDSSLNGKGRRCMETARGAIIGILTSLEWLNLPSSILINNNYNKTFFGKPVPSRKLREPRFLTSNSGYYDALISKYGQGKMGQPVFKAFEEDTESDLRQQLSEEGPWDIADRLDQLIKAIYLYSEKYHSANPGSRFLTFVATHYDTISPYIKKMLAHSGKEPYFPVAYGGGFGIIIDEGKQASTTIDGINYNVPLINS